jgi:toxin ParE1/3/4
MPESFTPVYLPAFREDVKTTLERSEQQFGEATAERYGILIQQALRDLLERPTRPGAQPRPDLAMHAYVYHLSFSRAHVSGERVKSPRYFLLYRHHDALVEFARLLHDSRDLARHIQAALRDE